MYILHRSPANAPQCGQLPHHKNNPDKDGVRTTSPDLASCKSIVHVGTDRSVGRCGLRLPAILRVLCESFATFLHKPPWYPGIHTILAHSSWLSLPAETRPGHSHAHGTQLRSIVADYWWSTQWRSKQDKVGQYLRPNRRQSLRQGWVPH